MENYKSDDVEPGLMLILRCLCSGIQQNNNRSTSSLSILSARMPSWGWSINFLLLRFSLSHVITQCVTLQKNTGQKKKTLKNKYEVRKPSHSLTVPPLMLPMHRFILWLLCHALFILRLFLVDLKKQKKQALFNCDCRFKRGHLPINAGSHDSACDVDIYYSGGIKCVFGLGMGRVLGLRTKSWFIPNQA